MARKRNEGSPCTGHNVMLCDENRVTVMMVKAEKEQEKKRTVLIPEAINEIILRYRNSKRQ